MVWSNGSNPRFGLDRVGLVRIRFTLSLSRPWILHEDGSFTPSANDMGIILTSPMGEAIEYAHRFAFPTSNNEAEYKAFLTSLNLAIELGVQELRVFSDSQLIIG